MVLENFIVDAPIVWDRVGKKIFENPHVKQGRKMRVQITNAGMVEDLSGYTLALGWKHTVSGVDGLDVFEDSSEANVGIFEMAYTENLMTNLGNLKASLVLTSVEDMVVAESDDFYVKVDGSPFGADAEQGVGSYTRLAEILLNEESRIAAEVARVSAEETRVTDFNALVDSEIIAQNVATKLQAKEAEYLPRLVSNEQQLAEAELNKVDKDGSGQVGWANIAQDARDQIIGATPPAVVGTNSVLEANLTNKAVTWAKRTEAGSFAKIFLTGDVPNFNTSTGIITFPSDFRILVGTNYYSIAATTIDYSALLSTTSQIVILFNVNSLAFTAISPESLTSAHDRSVIVAAIKNVSGQRREVYINCPFTVNNLPYVPDIEKMLLSKAIPLTDQITSFHTSGVLNMIQHKDTLGNTIRTDTFTFLADSVIEERKHNLTNTKITFTTNLATLTTEVN